MTSPQWPPDIDVLWDIEQPAASEARFRDLLARAPAADCGYRAELLTQLARAEGLQRHFDAAHRTLDEAQALLSADHPRARLRYLLERGRVHNSAGEPAIACPLFAAAWELASAHAEQLAWHQRALDLAERSADPR